MIQGPYLGDILDQPRALERTVERLAAPAPLAAIAERLERGGFRRVVLTGMGCSLHGLEPLQRVSARAPQSGRSAQ